MHEPSNQSLELEIARALEYDIVFGRLSPGERLREENIAQRLSASRHHVRSALMQLENAGIIVRERNKGARVQAYSAEEVHQLYDVREMLTRQAALRIKLPVAQHLLADVEAAQVKYEAALNVVHLPTIQETNDLFHSEFFKLCGNPYLVDLLKRLMNRTYVIRAANLANPSHFSKSCAEHRNIIALLAGTDSWALSELCVAHLLPSKVAYLEKLEKT